MNLLTDPFIRVRRPDGQKLALSLPQTLDALCRDDVDTFTALRPHQEEPWHILLAQLGTLAAEAVAQTPENLDAQGWQKALAALADSPASYDLVADDPTRPAFLQPPFADDATFDELLGNPARHVLTPDDLDVLITTRSHELKASGLRAAQPDDWLYALTSLQTTQGYSGKDSYGIVRANKGFANRTTIALAPQGNPGARFLRDVTLLLDDRRRRRPPGHRLAWELPWNGARDETLPFADFDPLAIEICRRLRLRPHPRGGLFAVTTTSKSPRAALEEGANGRCGFPWAPANLAQDKVLTIDHVGFTTSRLLSYLDPTLYERPLLLQPHAADMHRPTLLVANGLVRGRGKTQGHQHTQIALSTATLEALTDPYTCAAWHTIAGERLAQLRAIGNTLFQVINSHPAYRDTSQATPYHRKAAYPFQNTFESACSPERFFHDLQLETDAPEANRQTLRDAWLDRLNARALAVLDNAIGQHAANTTRPTARQNAVGLYYHILDTKHIRQRLKPTHPRRPAVMRDEPDGWNHPCKAGHSSYVIAFSDQLDVYDRKGLQHGNDRAVRKVLHILGRPARQSGPLAYWPLLLQAQARLQAAKAHHTNSLNHHPADVFRLHLPAHTREALLSARWGTVRHPFLAAIRILWQTHPFIDWRTVAAWLHHLHDGRPADAAHYLLSNPGAGADSAHTAPDDRRRQPDEQGIPA